MIDDDMIDDDIDGNKGNLDVADANNTIQEDHEESHIGEEDVEVNDTSGGEVMDAEAGEAGSIAFVLTIGT